MENANDLVGSHASAIARTCRVGVQEKEKQNPESSAMIATPSVLVAFPYWRESMRTVLSGKDWVLDSGAFTAHNQGTPIRLMDYVRFAKGVIESEARPSMVFALDVIGDAALSYANARAMWREGIKAIPTWHAGGELDALRRIAGEFPRIAIGGLAGRGAGGRGSRYSSEQKKRHIERAFSAVWPKWIHGFGVTTASLLDRFPFASVDSTSWILSPRGFGRWRGFKANLRVRGPDRVGYAKEIAYYSQLQERHRAVWRRDLGKVNELPFTIKLACGSIQELRHVLQGHTN